MLFRSRGRCLEQTVMEIMPFAIALYIGSTYPGYFAPLYHNMSGYIVMTVCLVIYIGAYMTGEKIMDRIADSL